MEIKLSFKTELAGIFRPTTDGDGGHWTTINKPTTCVTLAFSLIWINKAGYSQSLTESLSFISQSGESEKSNVEWIY